MRVWLLPEDEHWVAVAPDYDVVTQGQDQGLALRSLNDMVIAYLEDAADEGLSVSEAKRPTPLLERLRFWLGWIISRPAHWLHRRALAREGLFLPSVDGQVNC